MAKEKAEKSTNKNPGSLDYFGILKNAFSIVRHNKFLWILGALAGGGFANFNFGSGDFSGFTSRESNGDTSITLPDNQALDPNKLWGDAAGWIQANWTFVAVLIFIIVVSILILMALSIMARAGQIHAVDTLSGGQKASFGMSIKYGWHKFWKVLGVSLLIGLIMLSILILFALPAIALWFILPLFIVYIIFAILLMIPIAIVIGIIYEYALRYAVLKDERVLQSIKSGYALAKKQKKETFLVWLVTICTSIVSGIALVVALILIFIVLFLLGLLIFILNMIAGMAYAVVAIIGFLVVLFLAGGFIGSLISAYWTLCFKELSH